MASGSAEYLITLNWRGRAFLAVLKFAVLLGKLGLHRLAVVIGNRVLSQMWNGSPYWFDAVPVDRSRTCEGK